MAGKMSIRDDMRDIQNIHESLALEHEAIARYERFAEETNDPQIERMFRHIIDEELHHVEEFNKALDYIHRGRVEDLWKKLHD